MTIIPSLERRTPDIFKGVLMYCANVTTTPGPPGVDA